MLTFLEKIVMKQHGRRSQRGLYVVKLLIAIIIVLILCWNISMLSVFVQQPISGHSFHLLRSGDTDKQTPTASASTTTQQPPAVVSTTKLKTYKKTKPLPWFLEPEYYEVEDGCDFSQAVRLFDPEELPIHCGNIDQLVLGEKLGEGFWREVYKANWRGKDVAVKVVKDELMDRSDIIPRHVEEAAVIFTIRDEPNIVSLLGWCNSTVIVDYVPNPLDVLVYDQRDQDISVKRALELSRDAARGLAQLHAAAGGPFAHTDIQTRQFLLKADGTLLLNDFNRVKYTGPKRMDPSQKCLFKTPVAKGKWRSPEEYEHKKLDEKLDIYSLSLVLWSLRAREKPFRVLDKPQVYAQVPTGRRPPIDAMKDYPQAMQDLIVRAWDTDPTKRPTAQQMADEIDKILKRYGN